MLKELLLRLKLDSSKVKAGVSDLARQLTGLGAKGAAAFGNMQKGASASTSALTGLGAKGAAAFSNIQKGASASASALTSLGVKGAAAFGNMQKGAIALRTTLTGIGTKGAIAFSNIGKGAISLKNALFSIQGIIAIGLVGGFIKAADSMTQLQGKIKNVLNEGESFKSTFDAMTASAISTGSSIDAIGQSFVRLKPAGDRLGVTNEQLILFSETFSKMGALAGATTVEIKGSMIQLSQGIASGKLQGDELRTIMESMPPVVTAIAEAYSKRFGGSVDEVRGKIKHLAAEGLITPELIFQGLLDKADETSAKFDALPASVERAFGRMVTSGQLFINKLNEQKTITDTVAGALDILAAVIDGLTGLMSSNATEADGTTDSMGNLKDKVDDTAKTVKKAKAEWATFLVNVQIAVAKTAALFGALGTGLAIFLIGAIKRVVDTADGGLKAISYFAKMAADTINPVLAFFKQGQINVPKLGMGGVKTGLDKAYGQAFEYFKKLMGQIASPTAGITFNPPKTGGGVLPPDPPDDPDPPNTGGGGGGGARGAGGAGAAAKKEADKLKQAAEKILEGIKTVSQKRAEAIAELNKLRALYPSLLDNSAYKSALDKINDEFAPDISSSVEDMRRVLDRFFTDAGQGIDEIASEGLATSEAFNTSFAAYKQLLEEIATPQQKYAERLAEINELAKEYGLTQDQINDAIESASEQYLENGKVAEQYGQQILGVMQGIGQATEDALINVFKDGKFSARDFFASILEDIARLIFRMTVLIPIMNKLKKLTSGGGGGGGSTLGNIAGSVIKSLPGFANGGKPPVGRPSIVGERGPELFMPSSSGTVIPNEALGGGGGSSITQNINFTGDITAQTRAEVMRMAPQLERSIRASIQSEIINGGRFSKVVGRSR